MKSSFFNSKTVKLSLSLAFAAGLVVPVQQANAQSFVDNAPNSASIDPDGGFDEVIVDAQNDIFSVDADGLSNPEFVIDNGAGSITFDPDDNGPGDNELIITGPTSTFNNDLVVNGTSTLNGATSVTNGGLSVVGGTTTDSLTVSGNSDLNGNLDVDGFTQLDGLNVDGVTTLDATTVDGQFTVNGFSDLNGSANIQNNLTVQDNVTIQDDLTVWDDTTLGSSSTDTLNVNAGNVFFNNLPSSNSTDLLVIESDGRVGVNNNIIDDLRSGIAATIAMDNAEAELRPGHRFAVGLGFGVYEDETAIGTSGLSTGQKLYGVKP
ncbi:hypothetical protein [Picosynechococcus sp. PCC 73109]|uniref:hypothetical protein n=1 Tax=Picosynechococcus sp. PCC 73109 TaxID=374982 RepID=UPI000745866F|nr:hypothetical protein [Picosynechococcus sp. PCC 73109]AMA10091.1 hypothetical protein AWQ23_12625 [Picosynechococcus sp. PCC 73109]